jgi:hypothetical protein
MQDNYQIQMQSLLNQQIKKKRKALADAKKHSEDLLKQLEASEKNYSPQNAVLMI